MTKPGYKTKSFWAIALSMVLAVLMALGFEPNAVDAGPVAKAVGLLATLLAALGYTVWRGAVKVGDTTKPAWRQTEFWLSMAAILVSIAMASGVFEMSGPLYQALAAVAAVLAAAGYGGAQQQTLPGIIDDELL